VRCITVDSADALYLVGKAFIPTHNTTLALYTMAYQTYLLSCMQDPHETFDMDPSSEILMVFQSVNKQTASDIDYKRLRDMISNGPYFQERFQFRKDLESELRFPRNIGIKPVAGHDTAAIGANVIGGIMDEINFMDVIEKSKQATGGGEYDQAVENYNAIARRRSSRFAHVTDLPGMLCLVSSRKYPGQFTDRKEEEAKTNKRIYVYDKRLWEVRPNRYGMFTGKLPQWVLDRYGEDCPLSFQVFVGDATRKPHVLEPGEDVADDDRHLVMTIPQEERHHFDNDILKALRDVAGVATQAMNPFISNTDKVAAAFGKVPSLLSRPECDFKASRVLIYPKRVVNPEMPRFVHLDLGISRDACGFAVGHVPKFVAINRGEINEILPVIQFDALLRIMPPKNGEIEFSLVRQLIYKLRDLGLPIKWVTSDNQMMSKDTLNLLAQQGFRCGYQSVDTDTAAYDVLKYALYDERVLAPEHKHAQSEINQLEVDQKKQTIDHRPKGSKDVADAMAGVAYGLTMRREIWSMHNIPLINVPRSVTHARSNAMAGLGYTDRMRAQRGIERRNDRVMEELRDGPNSVRFPLNDEPAQFHRRSG
jgi:hypothetical protein